MSKQGLVNNPLPDSSESSSQETKATTINYDRKVIRLSGASSNPLNETDVTRTSPSKTVSAVTTSKQSVSSTSSAEPSAKKTCTKITWP